MRPNSFESVEDLLEAVDGGTETGDEEAAFGAVEDVFEAGADGALGIGIAGAVGVGGIGKQEQDAAFAVIGKGVEIEEVVIGGGGIDFEIAGVDDDAERGGDGHGNGAHDGVGDVDELDFEGADFYDVFGFGGFEGDVFDVVFFETAFDEGKGEGRGVDGYVEFGEEEGDGADVVFVPMGEQEGADVLAVFLEVGEVRGDDIDAEELVFGEHHAGVDDDDVVAVANGHHVHAELTESAERNDLELFI